MSKSQSGLGPQKRKTSFADTTTKRYIVRVLCYLALRGKRYEYESMNMFSESEGMNDKGKGERIEMSCIVTGG